MLKIEPVNGIGFTRGIIANFWVWRGVSVQIRDASQKLTVFEPVLTDFRYAETGQPSLVEPEFRQ